jgi:hypothetical protein
MSEGLADLGTESAIRMTFFFVVFFGCYGVPVFWTVFITSSTASKHVLQRYRAFGACSTKTFIVVYQSNPPLSLQAFFT